MHISTDPVSWQSELADSFTEPLDLLRFLDIDSNLFPFIKEASLGFPLRVPRHYASLMNRQDCHDPLLRQVLPLEAELHDVPGFVSDPVGDMNAVSVRGVLHKYNGRVLLIMAGACAVHCRYCFRREFPYGDHILSRQSQADALSYIAGDSSIHEVILSGGDPLLLSDSRLAEFRSALETIPHVRRFRIHSRIPVVLPSRMTSGLLKSLSSEKLKVVLVIHSNHPAELDSCAASGLTALARNNITLLNQSVLLKGVNDNVNTLIELSETLFSLKVLPYYLHLLDRARGTAHFEVPEAVALNLYDGLRNNLPGYLVPRLVREVEGEGSKRLVLPKGLLQDS
jgi:EF-P beta-lysylation protein EpmB